MENYCCISVDATDNHLEQIEENFEPNKKVKNISSKHKSEKKSKVLRSIQVFSNKFVCNLKHGEKKVKCTS